MTKTKKYYILTTEVVHHTYVVEANSEEHAQQLFYFGDYEIHDSESQSEEIHTMYCENEAIKL